MSGVSDYHVQMFVADVVKSFDTANRGILDCVLNRLELPGWFRQVYFEFHANVRFRSKLASGIGEAWTGDGGIPQGCPLSMMFIVALCLPRCRHLAPVGGVEPQLHADNLKCVCADPAALLPRARFSNSHVQAVGQAAAPSKCILMSTSLAVHRDMWDWVISGGGDKWKVRLVRDVGGQMDTTLRQRASTIAARNVNELDKIPAAGALPLGFGETLHVLRSKSVAPALHGIEASPISVSSLVSLRSAFVSAVWSSKMPLANSEAVLSLLDGVSGCDPAFFVVWARFRVMRRYLAFNPAQGRSNLPYA